MKVICFSTSPTDTDITLQDRYIREVPHFDMPMPNLRTRMCLVNMYKTQLFRTKCSGILGGCSM